MIDDTFISGIQSSLKTIQGQPGVAYTQNSPTFFELRYAKFNGTSWSVETVDGSSSDIGDSPSLLEVQGQPAIAYLDDTNNNLKYARFNGSTWDIQTVDSASVSSPISMILVQGRPAIAYGASGLDLYYIRSTDATGTNWGTRVEVVDSILLLSASLSVINGVPAIAYHDYSTSVNNNNYVKSNDSLGNSWGSPEIVEDDTSSTTGHTISLIDVQGRPAISYHRTSSGSLLRYARYNGSTWDIQTIADEGASCGLPQSMNLIDNKPAIVYGVSLLSFSGWQTRYIHSFDSTGTSWGNSELIDGGSSTSASIETTSLILYDGRASTTYYDRNSQELKFARRGEWSNISSSSSSSKDSSSSSSSKDSSSSSSKDSSSSSS